MQEPLVLFIITVLRKLRPLVMIQYNMNGSTELQCATRACDRNRQHNFRPLVIYNTAFQTLLYLTEKSLQLTIKHKVQELPLE
jgi:hypothetical protein